MVRRAESRSYLGSFDVGGGCVYRVFRPIERGQGPTIYTWPPHLLRYASARFDSTPAAWYTSFQPRNLHKIRSMERDVGPEGCAKPTNPEAPEVQFDANAHEPRQMLIEVQHACCVSSASTPSLRPAVQGLWILRAQVLNKLFCTSSVLVKNSRYVVSPILVAPLSRIGGRTHRRAVRATCYRCRPRLCPSP